MKSYDEMKESCTKFICEDIQRLEKEIPETKDLSVRKGKELALEDRKKQLNFIDESTENQIGTAVNEILFYLGQKQENLSSHEIRVENFPISQARNKAAWIGISAENLATYFDGKNANDKEVRDSFIAMVNDYMGTKIPFTGEFEELKERVEHAGPEERDQLLIEFYEMKSRGGTPGQIVIPSMFDAF